MTAEQLAQIAGVVLSLALAYIPAFAQWYAQKDAPAKARIMGGLLVLTAVGIYGLACARLAIDLGFTVVCDQAGLLGLFKILIAALIANQTVFLLAVRPFKR